MNIRKLKDNIKSNPRIDCLYLCLKSLKNVNECKKIIATKRSPYNIFVDSYGEVEKDKWIYFIELDEDYATNGFCSLLLDTILFLDYADTFSFEPVIKWGKNTLYFDKTVSEGENVFEYYFKPVSAISYNNINKCFRVTKGKEVDRYLNYAFNHYEHANDEIDGFTKIWKKYIVLRPDIYQLIKQEMNQILNNGDVLGVHVRATDYHSGYNNHPKVVMPEEYLEEVKSACKRNKFEKVFLATDDVKVIELFKNELREKLVFYSDSFRSSNGSPIHYGEASIQRDNHKYLLGLEIIKDMYTLGMCSGLIAGKSNVSECARIIKCCSGESYKYEKILDKGMHSNNKTSRTKIQKKVK